MLRILDATVVLTFCLLCVARETKQGNAMDNSDAAQPEDRAMAEPVHTSLEGREITWNCPTLLAIKREYETLYAELRKTSNADPPGKGARVLNDFLKKSFCEKDMRQLALSCAALPVQKKDRDPFTNDLLSLMVTVFVESGDRDSLLSLLSTRFVSRIGFYCDIELYLVDFGNKFKDPVLILGEAYAKCQVPEVCREIAAALRRAFTGLGVSGKDDSEFVDNAMRFYQTEKAHLGVNLKYVRNVAKVDIGDPYASNPLFNRTVPASLK